MQLCQRPDSEQQADSYFNAEYPREQRSRFGKRYKARDVVAREAVRRVSIDAWFLSHRLALNRRSREGIDLAQAPRAIPTQGAHAVRLRVMPAATARIRSAEMPWVWLKVVA